MVNHAPVWVTPAGVQRIEPGQNPPSEVGAKAGGLLWLPPAWVPPFFVLSPDFFTAYRECSPAPRTALIHGWSALLEEAVHLSGLNDADKLHLRSNAVSETLAERGKYQSLPWDRRRWLTGLAAFFEEAATGASNARIGVVVQRFVKPVFFGHLSNARRVAKEYRDAIIELTSEASGEMSEIPLSFRRWRKANAPRTDALVCQRGDDIPTVLREPLAYAASQRRRIHYEWLWDGRFVYIVQADAAPDVTDGVSPKTLVGKQPKEVNWAGALKVFRQAEEQDAKYATKLQNHFRYAQHGFPQPPFYIMNEPRVLGRLFAGDVDSNLQEDLEILTKRPLIIRTSSARGGGTLLPRSELLYTADQTVAWLAGPFSAEINRRHLPAEDLTLMAHHFIPAEAAAFSTGSPDNREVYVEALWGIPEGLYYYPCDAFLIDTLNPSVSSVTRASRDRFQIKAEVRFKGEFVAPNADGRFVVSLTAPPWDWKATIGDDSILREIALFTRQLAGIEGKRVKLMWFLGCAPWANLTPTLPWFHDFEADEWTTADSYQQNSRDETLPLRTVEDLEDLERKAAAAYKPTSVRRLVVYLDPVEDRIIRNLEIAERVGNAAKSLGAVVVLRGGILSHVYYALKRAGADVSVRHQPGFAARTITFNKLVRDRIPDVVAAGGEQAKISRLSPEEMGTALKIKLVEEAFEARDATASALVEELADVQEVLDALIKVSGIARRDLQKVRREKRARRGGFRGGVVLLETILAMGRNRPGAGAPSMLPPAGPDARVVEMNQAVRLETARPGPFDVREGPDFVEFVQTFDIGLTHPEWRIASPQEIRVNTQTPPDLIAWTVEGKREGGQMKLRLKIRLGTRQLRLPFESVERQNLSGND